MGGRPVSELRGVVVAELRKALSDTEHGSLEQRQAAVDQVRKRHADVPKRTWYLWLNDALGKTPKPKLRHTGSEKAVAARRDMKDRMAGLAAKAEQRRPREPKNKKPPPEYKPLAPGQGGGGQPFLMGVTNRFIEKRELPLLDPSDTLKYLAELYLDCQAVKECTVMPSANGDGHHILDGMTYNQASAIQARILEINGKMRDRLRGQQAIDELTRAILSTVAAENRDLALRMVAKVREVLKVFRPEEECRQLSTITINPTA